MSTQVKALPLTEQPQGFDLLHLPLLRRFIRWKYSRLVFQLPLLILALFVIVDGFTGRQLAPRNVATTSVWLHYRGLVVIALAFIGNAFCAACPLMLTRGPTKLLTQLLPHKFTFPAQLKNKYFVTVFLLGYFFCYEYFNLWASPFLTAWLVIGYFASALIIDTFFPAGTFCRYVCPLGNFNFFLSTTSPTQITAIDYQTCQSCKEKPCLHGRESFRKRSHVEIPLTKAAFIPISEIANSNGQGYFPGCETNLFVPTIQSNMDCTNCFNCVRACPYDNVAFRLRPPTWEIIRNPWLKRGRFALMFMGVLLTFYGLMNAFGMISPFFKLATFVSKTLNTESEALILTIFFIGIAIIGLSFTTLVACLADLLGQGKVNVKQAFMRWGYVTVVLGIGFWTAHYLFHFLTGAFSIIPVFEHFFYYRGFDIDPNWRLARLVPNVALFPINAGITTLYTFLALYIAVQIARRDFNRRGVIAMWPMLIYVLIFAAVNLVILAQPMEMRGTIFETSF